MHVELLYCLDGPDGNPDSQYRGLADGSAFFYNVNGTNYLVTARHNLTGRHWRTDACLGSYPVSPTHLRVTYLAPPPTDKGWEVTPTGVSMRIGKLVLPLINEDWTPRWLEHPTLGAQMDVAALSLERIPPNNFISTWGEPQAVDPTQHVAWPRLAPGTDVFVVGFPYKLSTGPTLPLWMRGTVASEPAFGYAIDGELLPLLLIDARTRSGQSGSAVMRHIPEGQFVRRPDGMPGVTTAAYSQLIGVYSGRTHDYSDLGFVWHIEQVPVDRLIRENAGT